ncbi:hypothetical protein GCK72_007490 [Caenorhabditis remanei]|uniref:CC domain-containing protein n=1 Tax=Caenorhabditis remanei TaxID=31234 RepID=A0A6A5HK82_CAERE|nr:hypothetical protein GCK72_007490 [Caenorhabditis remanei]KAF1767531.1 hypothetical protein GCK72_007490 [Caenorhabditis remanei]
MIYSLAILAVFIVFCSAQKTICEEGGEYGPSPMGMCPLGSYEVINQMCCKESKIRQVACEDQLDSNGKSMCPLSRLGCYRKLLGSLKEEIELCTKTCEYCPMPPRFR